MRTNTWMANGRPLVIVQTPTRLSSSVPLGGMDPWYSPTGADHVLVRRERLSHRLPDFGDGLAVVFAVEPPEQGVPDLYPAGRQRPLIPVHVEEGQVRRLYHGHN